MLLTKFGGGALMVKIAFSVDNHFDVNRVDGFEMLKKQAAYLVEHD